MKRMKKVIAAVLAAVLMVGTAVTANAADAIGSFYDTKLTLGEKYEDKIPYDSDDGKYSTYGYNNGSNYGDYRVTAPESGTMILLCDAAIESFSIEIYNAETYGKVESKCNVMTGKIGYYGWYCWAVDAGVFAACITFETEKDTDYIIRIARGGNYSTGYGDEGDGTIHLTAQMKLAGDANNDGSVNASDVSAILKHIAGIKTLSGFGLVNANADTDNDSINAMDVTATLQKIAGLR